MSCGILPLALMCHVCACAFGRLWSSPYKLHFVVQPLHVIDLIAFLPWYILLAVGSSDKGTSVFRIMRLMRVVRVLKLGGR